MERNKKLEIQHMLSMVISIVVVIIVIGSVIKINYLNKEESHIVAQKGILDIRGWNIEEEGNIKLDGQWEFYPNAFLEPNDINEYEGGKTYINVPGSWNDYLNKNGSPEGSGTYRLLIRVPEDRTYGIKTRTIRGSSRVYLNGEKIIQSGKPSLVKEEFITESKYKVGAGGSLNNEIELIIHVSSYVYRSGGILKSIEFGTFESIMKENNKSRALDAIAISVCLILSIYFFIIYFQRSKELYLLYFSLTNLVMSLYLSTLNEQLLDLIYNYDFATRSRGQMLSMIFISVCLLQFTHNFFKQYSSKRTTRIITIINLLPILLLLFFNNTSRVSPTIAMIYPSIIIMGYTMSYIYIFYILLKAIYNKEDSLEYILVVTISMFLYWALVAFKIFSEIDLGNTQVMLILLMLVGAAALMSNRLQLDYKEVNALSEKLIRYDELKDEFLARASHELRTPLHIIFNLTKNLLEGQKGTLNSKQQEDLFFIHQEGQRLTRLVKDLLDASQIKKEELKLRLGSIEPYKIVEDILKEMKILIPKDKSIILKNQIPSEFPALKADSDKFRQIIYNLVHNAIKYTKSGEVVVSASIISEEAEITVSDTGIGIKEKYLEEVFDIFYKEGEEGQVEQGLGLGLSIVRHLVEAQNGEIYVESRYGKGSTFKFTLPIYNEEIEKQEEIIFIEENILQPSIFLEKPPKLPRENRNNMDKPMVLIVDDEPLNQKVLVDIMDQLELNTILADNGREALNILEKEKIDLIILDLMLPDIYGDEVCKKIREEYSMVELPILILTASGKTVDLMNAFDYGANDFQRKPIDAEELKSRVQSLLLMKKSVEEGLEKEFQYFYLQISPHFLYNTINTIIGLSYKDSGKAREALNNLSIYFRGKLDIHRKKGLITLESELELIMAYLEIEEMRYGERLRIEYDIEEGLKAMIPPLTLQPLVENSVYHGVASKSGNGTIKVIAKRKNNGFITIRIEDDGVGMTPEKQEEILKGNNQRIGFKNVMEKVKIIKGAKLILESHVGEGTIVEIIIPEVKYDESDFS